MPDEVDRLFAAHGASENPWALPERRPTTLIALWPQDRAPTISETVAALGEALEEELEPLDEQELLDDDILWRFMIESERLGGMVGLWCEAARPLPAGELDDPEAARCKWVIGLQGVLHEGDPLSSLIDHVRLLCAAAPDTPALLDVEADRWHPRMQLERWFLTDELEPQADALWIIHAVNMSEDGPPESPVWLHTHGLWRCGLPELEMLMVPNRLAETAAELINVLGHLMLANGLNPPGQEFSIGPRARIMVVPWRDVVGRLPAEAPGRLDDREDDADGPHVGVRAVIVAAGPAKDGEATWTWPDELLEALAGPGMPLFMTSRETLRRSSLARHTWPELAMAWVRLSRERKPAPGAEAQAQDNSARVLIKAAYVSAEQGPSPDTDDEGPPREHLWFEIDQVSGDRAHGRLVNRPVSVESLREGDATWLEREQVSDWLVITPDGRFGPDTADELADSPRGPESGP